LSIILLKVRKEGGAAGAFVVSGSSFLVGDLFCDFLWLFVAEGPLNPIRPAAGKNPEGVATKRHKNARKKKSRGAGNEGGKLESGDLKLETGNRRPEGGKGMLLGTVFFRSFRHCYEN
jgi:hypothetical protein